MDEPLRKSLPAGARRGALSIVEKRAICLYSQENPSTRQEDIGVLFGVVKSTVSRTLGHKERYLKLEQEQKPYNLSESSAGVKATTPSSDLQHSEASKSTNAVIPIKYAGERFPCSHCTRTYKHVKHLRRHAKNRM
ncbi:unnamed protein product [Clonostachys rosea f. rosea IK726]|uniref:Uncharacterized protein n=1 Tax=Clonostachys rosea f. rosea IK726 TaxID=1349383 RepID=A0ACA9UEX6_BIOOC|nr:unnamed protein product [Clonostachys rosea f. rosea IK726]